MTIEVLTTILRHHISDTRDMINRKKAEYTVTPIIIDCMMDGIEIELKYLESILKED